MYISNVNVGCWLVVWYPIVILKSVPRRLVVLALYCQKFFSDPFCSGKSLFIEYPPFFGKAGLFTLENHIHVQALKMQVFPNNEMSY